MGLRHGSSGTRSGGDGVDTHTPRKREGGASYFILRKPEGCAAERKLQQQVTPSSTVCQGRNKCQSPCKS